MKRFREWINQNYLAIKQSSASLSERSKLVLENFFIVNDEQYSLKIASADDANVLVELQKQCYPLDSIWSESLLRNELLHNPNCLYLIVYNDQEPIAFIGSWIKSEECHVSNIVTIPTHQRLGIGTYLLEQIERIALLNQCTQYTLEVRVSNTNAQSLYKKLGFKTVRLKAKYYSNDLEDAFEMTKRLNHEITPYYAGSK